MVLIQEIEISWPKCARSSKNSQLRRAIPEAAILPRPLPNEDKLVLHRVGFSLNKNEYIATKLPKLLEFSEKAYPDYEVSDLLSDGGFIRIQSVKIYPGDNLETVKIKLAWHLSSGAPTRPFRHLLTLEKGKWFRLVYNARHGGRQQWSYTQTTMNIGYFTQAPVDVFLKTAPLQVIDERESLL